MCLRGEQFDQSLRGVRQPLLHVNCTFHQISTLKTSRRNFRTKEEIYRSDIISGNIETYVQHRTLFSLSSVYLNLAHSTRFVSNSSSSKSQSLPKESSYQVSSGSPDSPAGESRTKSHSAFVPSSSCTTAKGSPRYSGNKHWVLRCRWRLNCNSHIEVIAR